MNRLPDNVRRVLWTAAQAGAGAALDALTSGQVTPRAVAYAVAFAILKAVVAHGATMRRQGDGEA